jgi:hypothetical protein
MTYRRQDLSALVQTDDDGDIARLSDEFADNFVDQITTNDTHVTSSLTSKSGEGDGGFTDVGGNGFGGAIDNGRNVLGGDGEGSHCSSEAGVRLMESCVVSYEINCAELNELTSGLMLAFSARTKTTLGAGSA